MEELQKALDIAVTGPQRDEILAAFDRHLAEWNMKLPAVDPLVLDFGLGHFDEVGLVESWICNEMEAGYCGKYLFLFDGQTCPMHRHRKKTVSYTHLGKSPPHVLPPV